MATTTWDGKQIIPIFTDSPDYKEWEVSRDGIDYLITNEDGQDGDWELYQLVPNGGRKSYQLCGVGIDVDRFLKTHHLILGN